MERRSKLMALRYPHQRVAQMMIDVARSYNSARFRVCIDLVAQSTRAFDCSRSCPHD
jgi:hypothetical protein